VNRLVASLGRSVEAQVSIKHWGWPSCLTRASWPPVTLKEALLSAEPYELVPPQRVVSPLRIFDLLRRDFLLHAV
jgi:hypothetical protein